MGPEGRGIFHNEAKTFLLWVNEEDQMRIISMEKGGDVKGVFARLARGIAAVGESVKAECGKDFALSEQYGFIHSSRRGVRSLLSSLVEPVESPVASTAAPTTSPTNTGSDTPRYSSSRS